MNDVSSSKELDLRFAINVDAINHLFERFSWVEDLVIFRWCCNENKESLLGIEISHRLLVFIRKVKTENI